MATKHSCVAIFTTHDQADEAFTRLLAGGADLSLLSCVGRGYWEDLIGSRNAGARFQHRGEQKQFWDRRWSGMRGWGVFWFFADGPAFVAGPLVRSIVATQEEGGGDAGATGFMRGLAGIGIPADNLVIYEDALLHNQILIVLQGTLKEIDLAHTILCETGSINQTIHHSSMN